MSTHLTCHSEYGKLKSVYLKRPKHSFISQSQIDKQWEKLNYLEAPDLELALAEYEELERYLQAQDIACFYFSENETVSIDSIYCRDASIATDHGMILCNMGKGARVPEPRACGNDYVRDQLEIIGQIEGEGTIEGGDVAWLDEKMLAVGHGYRSNDAGYQQLKAILEPLGIETMQVDLPHYKGEQDVFHLMSIFSPVDKDLAVVYSPLMPVRFRKQLLALGYELVEVPESEFESMGCNVLAIGPRKCVMLTGNPITETRLMEAGCEVYSYTGENISLKGGGGPTCLTRPLWREIV